MKKILLFLILIFTLTFSGCATSEVKVGVKVELPETFYVYGVLDEHRATVIKVKGTLVFDKNFNNVGYTLTNQDGVEKHFNVKGKLYSKGPFYVYEFDYEECYDVLYKGEYKVRFYMESIDGNKAYLPDEYSFKIKEDLYGYSYVTVDGKTGYLHDAQDKWSELT